MAWRLRLARRANSATLKPDFSSCCLRYSERSVVAIELFMPWVVVGEIFGEIVESVKKNGHFVV